ncbi:retrovirus-related Pol polyprotein from type-2 retrotransposable element R2DM, partial [Nephila pilipes]
MDKSKTSFSSDTTAPSCSEMQKEKTSNKDSSGTPIALRTRSTETQISYREAALLGLCKICNFKCKEPSKLRTHIINHRPNTKRRKALEAVDAICHSFETPKPNLPIYSSSPPSKTCLFDKFKNVYPEFFTEETTSSCAKLPSVSRITHKSPVIQSPILTTSDSKLISSIRPSSPLHDDIANVLNQIIQSVSSHIERSSILEQSTKSSFLATPTCVPRQDANVPTSKEFVNLSHSVYKDLNKDNIYSLYEDPTVNSIKHPSGDCRPFSSTTISSGVTLIHDNEIFSEKKSPVKDFEEIISSCCPDSNVASEIESLVKKLENDNSDRHSPDILDIIMPSSQDLSDDLLSSTPLTLTSRDFIISDTKNVLPGPPIKPAFKKSSYAQVVKNILASCAYCEKKFYFTRSRDIHILDFHGPDNILNSNSSKSSSLIIIPVDSSEKTNPSTQSGKKSSSRASPSANPKFSKLPFKDRKIIAIQDPIKKKIQPKLFPAVPEHRFFCRHCQDFFPSNSSLSEHLKLQHNIKVQTFRRSPKTSEIPISQEKSPPSSASTTILGQSSIIVPHVNDHQDLMCPVTATLKNFYVPDPNKIKVNDIKETSIVQNLSRRISTQDSSDSPLDPINVCADIHIPPTDLSQNSQSKSPPRICNICNYKAKNRNALKLHFYRKHKYKIIPPAPQFQDCNKEEISVLPPSGNCLPSIQANVPKKKLIDSFVFPSSQQDLQDFVPPPVEFNINVPVDTSICNNNTDSNLISNKPFVSFNNSVLQYSFPVSNRMSCPIKDCAASFGTKNWFHTNTSIKRHLNVFHKQKPNKVTYHCSICDSMISKNPSKHGCLIKNLILPETFPDDDVWICPSCPDFSAVNPLAKQNHLAFHNRMKIKEQASKLVIPPSYKSSKKKKLKRVRQLADGLPGDIPLAPPIPFGENVEVPVDDPPPVIHAKIDIERVKILDSFCEPLDSLFEVDDIEEAMVKFENILQDLTVVLQEHYHLSVPSAPSSTQKKNSKTNPFDANNAQAVQKLYKWNRRRCIRNIVNPNSDRCQVPTSEVQKYFQTNWSPPRMVPKLLPPADSDLPPIVDLLSPETVASCLQGCENSAPGPDLITYAHWRNVDPRCFILSKIFNICLKFKAIPQYWKTSNCILLPKKGDLKELSNWRPISLSCTIYKLFTKCLARRLQDWCEMNNTLSSCQKGFTPFDGVVEHNFVIGQHLEVARRSHSESFLVWLDISNAFGSISHDVLFSAMAHMGIDSEFIQLIKNIYLNSSSKIFSVDGSTEPIPIRCGVKQGCPLSGILFNIAINNILLAIQKGNDKHSILAFADDL